MIRINLVAGERRATKSATKRFDATQKITVIGSVIVIVTVLLIGWRYWAHGQSAAQLEEEVAAARREENRLAEVLKQVASFEERREQLRQRLALIDELRKGQNAPVHMIDQISRSLPEMTWLMTVQQQNYDITIQGRSTSLSALSDFVSNLESTRYFQRPVEIVESQVASGQKDGVDLIEFTIRGKFQMAGIDPPSAAAAGKKKGAKKGA